MQLWDCNDELQQRWTEFTLSPDERTFNFWNQLGTQYDGNAYLDADTHTLDRDGTKIQLWTYEPFPQQVFYWNRL